MGSEEHVKLTAVSLKDALWSTLQSVRDESMEPARADVIAAQAREIIRTSRLQLAISAQAKVGVPLELQQFSNPNE